MIVETVFPAGKQGIGGNLSKEWISQLSVVAGTHDHRLPRAENRKTIS